MNVLAQKDPLTTPSERAEFFPNGYPLKDWPYTLFFNGEAMPRHSQLWHPISKQVHDHWATHSDDPIAGREILDVIWDLESLGVVKSCAPAVFIFAIQELLLFAFERAAELRAALPASLGLEPDTEAVFQALLEGGFRMRESVLAQRKAYWSVGYEENDLPALCHEMAKAFTLPADYSLPPHQQHRQFFLKTWLSSQATRFHTLAQSGTLPKVMRRRLHNVRMPDDAFLRLIL